MKYSVLLSGLTGDNVNNLKKTWGTKMHQVFIDQNIDDLVEPPIEEVVCKEDSTVRVKKIASVPTPGLDIDALLKDFKM